MNDNSFGIREAKATVNQSELDRIMQGHIDSGQFNKEQLAQIKKREANKIKEAKAVAEEVEELEVEQPKVTKPNPRTKLSGSGSTPSDVLGANDLNFFNKTEEKGVETLRELYGDDFIFEEKFLGSKEGGGVDAITVSTKDGKKSASFDMNINGSLTTPNRYGKKTHYFENGQAKIVEISKEDARNTSYDILTNFIKENSTQEGLDSQATKKASRKELLKEINAERDIAAAAEIAEVEEKFESGDLFIQETKKIFSSTTYGHASAGTYEDIAFEKELKRAQKQLSEDGGKPTKEQVQILAKSFIIDKIQEEKLTSIMNKTDFIQRNDYLGINKKEGVQERYNLAAREFDIDFKKEMALYDLKRADLETGGDVTRYEEINSQFSDGNHEYEIKEGESYIELENGKKVPEKIIKEYKRLQPAVTAKVASINKLSESIQEKAAKYGDNAAAIDISRRNYNAWEEFVVETSMGFYEIGLNVKTGVPLLLGGENKKLINKTARVKAKLQETRDSYSKDVEFEDAFSSIGNFASFAAQEVSNQIPIFAALAIPYVGTSIIGVSAFGDHYVNLNMERDTPGGRQKSNGNIWWSSVGFGASELVFERLTTIPLLRAAKRGFSATPGSKMLQVMTDGQYFKKHIGKAVYGALSEPIGEGMTQITQNWIDGKPMTHGLGHAMFSGLMFGTTFSAAPFVKGAYLNKYNDHASKAEVRKRVKKMRKLGFTNQEIDSKIAELKEYGMDGREKAIRDLKKDKKINEKIIAQLYDQNVAEMKELEIAVQGISSDVTKMFFGLEQQQEKLKLEAQEIENNKTLTKKQRNDQLKVLQAKFDAVGQRMEAFKDKKAFGDEYTAFKGLEENAERVADLEKRAKSELFDEGKKDPTAIQINDKAKFLYNVDKINADHRANSKAGLTNVINAQTKEEAIAKVNKLVNVDEKDKKEIIKGIEDGNHGVNITTIDGENLPMQIVESMAADDRLETRTHEVGHSVFIKAISRNSKAFDGLADQILEHLKTTNPSAYKRVIFRLNNQTASDEVIMLFLEEVASNKVDIKKTGKAGFFATLMNKGIEEVGGKPIDLKGETDAISFLIGIAKKIKAGTINAEDIAEIKANKIAEDAAATAPKAPVETKAKASAAVGKRSPEDLIKIIKRKSSSPAQIKAAEDALVPQYEALAVEALKYTEAKGDILRKNVVSAVSVYYKAIVRNYDPKKGKFSTHVYNNIAPKNDTIFEEAKTLEKRDESVSLNAPEAMQVEGDAGKTTNTEKTFVQKINILQDFAIANRVADKIKALVKVVKGDNFKSIISKYAGKVGELIFEVPANKIMEGGANLAAVTKYTEGMPAPAEAQNIQRFFNAPNNADKFLKTLPLYNVTDKTADINKIGENLDVSRDTYGYAIGLKGLPLDYFYENYTDPTGEITSPKGRSKGLTSQTQVKRLKPQFRKPTSETVDQFKEDLGITPKNEANVYSRDIGQLLKGVAKVHSINAAISGAQRVQEAKLKTAPVTEQKAIKQQTADITAAQNKVAFSKAAGQINILSVFELETKGIDKLLKQYGIDGVFGLKNEKEIDEYIAAIKKDLLPLMPKEFWFGKSGGTVFTGSSKVLGTSEASKKLYKEYYEPAMKALANDVDVKFGAEVKGVSDYSISSYKTIFKDTKTIKANIKNGKIKEWNKKVALIHEAMWFRIGEAIGKDKNKAKVIGNYMKMTGSDTKHWHKRGAQFVGYSVRPQLRYEYEHAMPATAAYLYLMDAALSKSDFKASYKVVKDNYKLMALDKAMDKKLTAVGLQRSMPKGWDLLENNWWDRYFNSLVASQDGGIDPSSIKTINGKTFGEEFNVNAEGNSSVVKTGIKYSKTLSKAGAKGRTSKFSQAPKGITVLDFDDTLATSNSLIRFTKPDGTKGTLNAEQYASTYEELTELGYEWDFSEFNKVVNGKTAPLFNKAMKLQGKFGPENMFVLTARPMEAAPAIFAFLQANGLNIPLKNITGLANSTANAKALWMVEKVGDGYNDFYFADDALQNVQAVDNILEQFDVKRKVQQAKIKFSKGMSKNFNDILEATTDVKSEKVFSDAQAKIRGAKPKYKGIIPPSAQDFMGLIYNFVGKGKKGDADIAFFKKALVDPFARGIDELNTSRQNASNDYKNLQKAYPEVKKIINKKIEGSEFTNDQAARVYLWNKAGFDVPGLSKKDLKTLVEHVEGNPDLKKYADVVGLISKKEQGYSAPGDYWLAENITSDLLSDGAIGDARSDLLAEWQENVDVIFSKDNLNKIESIYGANFREALEDSLYRMRTGRNRPAGGGRIMNTYMNWVNNSVGAIMFFNMRSAILQTISATNYINWSFNNPAKAALAFANQPQYWKDFSMIFNSAYLKQRRSGNQRGINEAELSAAVAGTENKAKAAIAWLLKKGFLPTQLADSFAIASGGATFYRNKVKALVKEGMTQEQAESQAFLDFQETTEVSQQSARPDMISQQQASPLGRLILSFQNTPMQYARIMNKAARDLANGRGDTKTHLSKIAYYGVAQSILFGALQSALLASTGEDEEEEFDKKKYRILNGMIDSVLSGIGYGGKAISTAKNAIREYIKQKDKGWNADHTYTILSLLSFSPPIGSKLRKIYSSIQTEQFNKGIFIKRGLTLDNPIWSGIGNVVEGVTNVPLGRLANKMLNIDNALDESNSFWERTALLLGWSTWDLGIRDPDIEALKEDLKKDKEKEKKSKKEVNQEAANKKKQAQEKRDGKKDVKCAAVSKSGNRCKTKIEPGSSYCTIHAKVKSRKDGKKVQCKKVKSNKKRCGMQTGSVSGYCYYHD